MIMEIVKNILMGIGVYTVIHFVITVLRYVFSEPGLPNNRPTPLNRKSFKERLEEKQALANHHGYQPTDKMDTSNPPKQNKHDENI